VKAELMIVHAACVLANKLIVLEPGSVCVPCLIEALHEGRRVKAGERQEVVDRASQKGLPRIGFDNNNIS
jgi:hypothetical protein